MLVMIEDTILLIEQDDDDSCVSIELQKKKKYWTYAQYKLGLYDEENDSFMFVEFIKVKN